MSSLETKLPPDSLHKALAGFWSEALKIETTPNGLVLAVPQTGADGWQLVINITETTPGIVRISDAGRTLSELAAMGQNIDSGAVSRHVNKILRDSHMSRENLELIRVVSLPVNPVDLHVFAEALSAISYLWVLHEPSIRTLDVADETLRRVFSDREIKPQREAVLNGKTEKNVKVDYLVVENRPVAFEILRRKKDIYPLMEQWGYRWQDLKKVAPELMPVMIFDPATQEIDEGSRAIGEEVCSLFCAYDQTDRIHQVLEAAAA